MQSVSRETHTHSAPPLPADPAWDEAFLRVESYLRSYQLESRVRLNRHASEILREAAERVSAHPGEEPVEAAMHVTRARIEAWFSRTGDPAEGPGGRVRAERRLALVLADFPARWADTFLSPEPPPAEFAASLEAGVFEPSPALTPRTMPPAELEFGLNRSERIHFLSRHIWPSLPGAATWLGLLGLFGVVWIVLH